MTKSELLVLVKSAPVPKTYTIDKLFYDAGHDVLLLPPYHCDLNPIELVWGDIKGRLGECLAESMAAKKEMCMRLFSEYTPEKWKKCCEHVEKIEELYWERDALMDENVDRIIISLNDDDSESSESSDNETIHSLPSEDGNSDFEDIRVLDFDSY
ncbi:uncharacterized protein LOC128981989 [Macrosteles quadrilineatus]|uniref:uncharacterized protein LOC128981989 n=1 Tax=Macrosteles quadrilineatus TaxID=74068 RepID=UPI0023E181AB|nr:uncharacterized protein LOC128981989 [Macrosteles quadrilineatus]